MLHTFIDESYGKDHYYVGGIVFTADQVRTLENSLMDLKKAAALKFPELGDVDSLEFHAHRIMQGQNEWKPLLGRPHEGVWICRSIIHAVVNAGGRIHLQGVDVARLNALYRYPDTPYRVSLRHLLERVNEHCETAGMTTKVTADILDEHGEATAAIAGYVRRPTPGYRPTRLAMIEQPLTYVDSSSSLGVQAADVVTYVLRRHLEEKTAHPKAQKAAR
ncbi:DUF3800 domain-containing protein [Nocardia camponoti]|uniref:DUF3800 domain-containing protein n=1 Tax=Nocardia camponoti TaxID=1616106 RepID=A0A917QRX4_9NOCA|nr:DUF3800 domain-containing protein [Nocardia camponoti]GGK64637.1 hypothetical protein GCM10011591_41090 [Nocardia camponoti]